MHTVNMVSVWPILEKNILFRNICHRQLSVTNVGT